MATSTVSINQAAPQSGTPYSMSSLYVGDLHPDVTEAMLFDKFQTAGPILSIRVCRDVVTRQSLGYAYINYQQAADAERALDSLNFEVIRGKSIRIMWSQRDPAMRRTGVGNVFIKNLDNSIDNKSLYDTFSAFGSILSCKIMADENEESRGYGFVHFENEDASKKAIETVNGMLLAGKKVYVGPFVPRAQRLAAFGPRRVRNLFIKNFDKMLDDEKLREIFEPFGKITSCVVKKNEQGESKGFGFCCFENPDDAEKAMVALKNFAIEGVLRQLVAQTIRPTIASSESPELSSAGEESSSQRIVQPPMEEVTEQLVVQMICPTIASSESPELSSAGEESSSQRIVQPPIESRKIQVLPHKTKKEREREKQQFLERRRQERLTKYRGFNLYIKNLDDTIDDAKLRETFEKYGTIISAKVMMQNGRSKGFGFVCFSAPDEATKAVTEMNGAVIGSKPLYVALAQTKEYRRAVLAQQFAQRTTGRYPGALALPYGGGLPAMYPYMTTPMNMTNTPIPYSSSIGQVSRSQPRWSVTAAQVNPNSYQYSQMATPYNGAQPRASPVTQSQQRPMLNQTAGNRQLVPRNIHQPNYPMNIPNRTIVAGPRVPFNAAYTPVARNINPSVPTVYQTGMISQQEPLTSNALANASPQQQKQMLGERLYLLIQQMKPPAVVGKITGMLLELDNTEILHLLESNDALRTKVDEAEAVLFVHQQKQTVAANNAVMSINAPNNN